MNMPAPYGPEGYEEPPPQPRTPVELAEALASFETPYYQQGSYSTREHAKGGRMSLLWVMGKAAEAPVSRTVLGRPPTMEEIETEAEYAYEAMSGSSERGRGWQRGRTAGYLQGCENTLFWAAKLGDDEFGM